MSNRTFSFSDLDTQKKGEISMAEYEKGFEILKQGQECIKISDFDKNSQRFFYALQDVKLRTPETLSFKEYKSGFTFIVKQLTPNEIYHELIENCFVKKSDFDKIVHTKFCDWEDYTMKFCIIDVQRVFEAKFIFAWSILQEYLETLNVKEKRTEDNFNEYRMPRTATKKVWYNLFSDSDLYTLGKYAKADILIGYIDLGWIETAYDEVIFRQIQKIQRTDRKKYLHINIESIKKMCDIESICTGIFPEQLSKVCPCFYEGLKKHSIHWSIFLPVNQLLEINNILIQYKRSKIVRIEASYEIYELFKKLSMPEHQHFSRELYQNMKVELYKNLRTDVWQTFFEILGDISPNVRILMKTHTLDVSDKEFMSLKTILVRYKRGLILEKNITLFEIGQIFKELLTKNENIPMKEIFMAALFQDYELWNLDPISLFTDSIFNTLLTGNPYMVYP
jgi:hypothetical protein